MQFVSNSLFKATPLFEGSGEIRFLNSTCCVPGLMKATCHPGKCRAICSIFFLSKDNTCSQRSPPGVVPSRTRAPVVQCWTVLNHHDPRWFPSNRTLCSVGLPVLPGDILLLNIALSGLHLRAFSKHQPQTFSKFPSKESTPAVVTVTSFSLNATSLEPTPEGLQ